MLSGKEVFDNILQHETVFNKKMAGENPTIPVTIDCEEPEMFRIIVESELY